MYGNVMKNSLLTYSASKRERQLGSKHEVGLPVAEELDLSVVVVVEVVVVVVGVVVQLLV